VLRLVAEVLVAGSRGRAPGQGVRERNVGGTCPPYNRRACPRDPPPALAPSALVSGLRSLTGPPFPKCLDSPLDISEGKPRVTLLYR